MNIGIIGLGSIAEKAQSPVLYSLRDFDVTVTSRRMEAIERTLGRHPKFGYAQDLKSLIEKMPIAAFVLTPKDTQYSICRGLVASGIDDYVEKPTTLR